MHASCVQGSIFLYACFIKSSTARIVEAKSMATLSLSVFKYPPGKEPSKTADDGKGGRKTLPDKEDNSTTVKVRPCTHAPLARLGPHLHAYKCAPFIKRRNPVFWCMLGVHAR
jgi:hypothetical protein